MVNEERPDACKKEPAVNRLSKRAHQILELAVSVAEEVRAKADYYIGKEPEAEDKGDCEVTAQAGVLGETFQALDLIDVRLSEIQRSIRRL